MKTLRNWFLPVLLCTHFFSALAQTEPFGRPAVDDLKMTVYPADSSADAVVLSNVGSAVITKDEHRGYIALYKRHLKIKILKKSGVSQATVLIPFYRQGVDKEDRVEHLQGVTHNLRADGSVQSDPLTKEALFEERRSENLYVKRFTLPNVRQGSVIEFQYEISSDFVFELREWNFQQEIPVRWSEYKLSLMPGFMYRILFQGFEPLVVDKSQPVMDGVEYHWAMKDLPAIREEPNMVSPENYRAKVWFELSRTTLPGIPARSYSSTWEDLDRTLMADEQFGGALRKTAFLKPVAAVVRASVASADTLQWVQAAHRHVTQAMTWNKTQSVWASRQGLKQAYEAKTGSATDLNLILVGLLNEMGVEAKPVILSTKQNGLVSREHPLISKFNYTIGAVTVGGKDLLLDATDPLLKAGSLPVRCLNGDGRLVALRRARWLTLNTPDRNRTSGQFQLAIQSDGTMTGTVSIAHLGYAGAEARRRVLTDGSEKYKQRFRSQNPGWNWSTLDVTGVDKPDEALVTKGSMSYGEGTATGSDRIYLHPLPVTSLQNNPFKLTERRYPVDMGVPLEEVYTATYTLPEGYSVEEAPKGMALALPDNGGRFSFQLQVSGRQVQVASRLVLNKAIFMPQEYESLRLFYDKLIAKHAEQLILVKGAAKAQISLKNE